MTLAAIGNLFEAIPPNLETEVFEDIIHAPNTRIERIISHGHRSPASGWYDQAVHEWVVVLQGAAKLEFDDGRMIALSVGDYVNIPAHAKHRVSWTTPDQPTIWLAIFYSATSATS